MRTLSARIFSKSFGGKIELGQTDVEYEKILTKKHDAKLTPTLFSSLIRINF